MNRVAEMNLEEGFHGDRRQFLQLASVGLLSTVVAQKTEGTEIYKAVSKASGRNQPLCWADNLDHPHGIAVDISGNIFVTDSGNHQIQKFNSSGKYVTKWGSKGNGDGDFNFPRGIAVDRSGNIFVADTHNQRVQKFDVSGKFLIKWGSRGSKVEFFCPKGIAVGLSGKKLRIDKIKCTGCGICASVCPEGFEIVGAIAVVKDENANCVFEAADACPEAAISIKSEPKVFVVDNNGTHKFDSSGKPLAKWGSGGSGDGQVNWPHSVAVDPSGNVFVADTNNNRIQKFGPSGKLLHKWGSKGDGKGEFNHPGSIAVDLSGNVFVVDTDNNRIQVFNSSGKFLTKWGSRGKQEGQFNSPYGIAVDSSGNVFVADTNNNRIQKFSPSGELPTKQKAEGAEISKEELPLDENERIDIGHRGKEIIETAYKLGHEYEGKHRGCCRCTVAALQGAMEFVPKDEDVFRTACCLDGGATPTGIHSCGGFTGSGIIIGYLCGTNPFGDTGLSHKLIGEVYKKFKDKYGSVLCKDVKEKGKGNCPEVVGRAARWITETILRQFSNYGKEPTEK